MSTNSFYYWAKRLRPASARVPSRIDQALPAGRASATPATAPHRRKPWCVSAGSSGMEVLGSGGVPGGDPLPGRLLCRGRRAARRGVPGSGRPGVSGESPPCSPPRCCLPWGRRRSTSTPSRPTCGRSFDGLHAIVQSEFRPRHPCRRRVRVSQSPAGSHQAAPLGSGRHGDLDEATGTRHLPETAVPAGGRAGGDRRHRSGVVALGDRTDERETPAALCAGGGQSQKPGAGWMRKRAPADRVVRNSFGILPICMDMLLCFRTIMVSSIP